MAPLAVYFAAGCIEVFGIQKRGCGEIEIYTVLAAIGPVFVFVPFELHLSRCYNYCCSYRIARGAAVKPSSRKELEALPDDVLTRIIRKIEPLE